MLKEKKRKRGQDDRPAINGQPVNTSKPSAVFKPTGGRLHTLSIALPGSIVANAVSHDQKNYLAGTIARALAVFCVDEVVIFDDQSHKNGTVTIPNTGSDEYTATSDPSHFLAHLLSYLETPPYLRRSLLPQHPNLRTAGALPSLDMPHHSTRLDECSYREGVTCGSTTAGTEVDVGLPQKRLLKGVEIPSNTRITLAIDLENDEAEAVPPTAPREEAGYYWGYTVRRCPSLSTVFTECPFDGGYDLSFGTSERGKPLKKTLDMDLPVFSHMIIVLGGVAGLETAARNDPDLQVTGIGPRNVGDLFDHWVNLLPSQGSRTIRTEEAVWLSLMGLSPIVERNRPKS